MATNAQAEELRHATLEILASRPGTALDLSQIRRRIDTAKMVDFTMDDVALRQALAVLIAMGFVTRTHDPLGATEYFQADAAGILAYERGT